MRVLQIALNNPDSGSALDIKLCNELLDAFDRAKGDRSVGAILFTARCHQRLFGTIQRIHKPIVAAVHGSVFDGGTGLADNAHVVVAHQETRFALTEVRTGYWPVFIFRAVEHAIGERRAMELSLTGREFKAEEAFRFGLVTEISSNPVQTRRRYCSSNWRS